MRGVAAGRQLAVDHEMESRQGSGRVEEEEGAHGEQ